MYRFITMLALGALLPAMLTAAPQLTVNAPALTETIRNDATLPVAGAAALQASEVMVVCTTVTFTLPTDTPAFETVKNDRLAVAADKDGTLLISNDAAWKRSGLRAAEGEPVDIRALGRVERGTLIFDVTLTLKGGASETLRVVSPNRAAASGPLTEMIFAGEGSATGISVAQVSSGILPAEPGASQDPAQVGAYVTWINDSTKGGALPSDASDEAKQNAFAMNAGGTPKLQITALDPVAKTVTVRGSYEPAKTPGTIEEAPLDAINGKLYLTYAETLNGPVTVKEIPVSATVGGAAVVKLPDGAVFAKATVSLTKPADILTK